MDAFLSSYSEGLRLCKTYWHTKDAAWLKRWDEHFWGLLWIHCNPGCVPHAITKMESIRAKVLLVLTESVWVNDQMVRLQDDLQRMTLNSYEFPAGQSIYQVARGQKLGNTPGQATVVYVNSSLLDEVGRDTCTTLRTTSFLQKGARRRPSGGNMNPSPRAPLNAMHLSVECLTIAPSKMSREEETPPIWRYLPNEVWNASPLQSL